MTRQVPISPVEPAPFDAALAPLTRSEFLRHYARKEFLHSRGRAGRFAELLPWETFSEILDQHRLDYPRLRLIRRGETLPPSSYIDYLVDRRGARYPRVNATGLHRELSNGAMIHFAAIDEMRSPIRLLAADIAAICTAHVTVNVCAGTGDSRGFATHWDGHDVLVLQVHGRKKWRVYGFTTPSPVRVGVGMDTVPMEDRPTRAVWEATLEDGDILYLPRGCWHSAEGTVGPTLHLTIGITGPTGLDYLRWLLGHIHDVQLPREDIPEIGGHHRLTAYVDELRAMLHGQVSIATLSEFLADYHDATVERTCCALPVCSPHANGDST